MRISDWSSDVCSSDLVGLAQARKIIHLVEQQPDDVALRLRRQRRLGQRRRQRLPRPRAFPMTATRHLHQLVGAERLLVEPGGVAEVPRSIERIEIGRASGRERGCQYVSRSGVAGSLKKKKKTTST